MKNCSVCKWLLCLSAVLAMAGCSRNPHFITDRKYRKQVHADFTERQKVAQGRAKELFGGMDTLNNREREALEFLYAYMPYSDLADYDGAFYLKQVRAAFEARDTFSWGKDIPEDVFRHFVLVYRVNNENLDTARLYMYRQLKARVEGLTMEQAALEVNHWCHEHMAYRASDARTSAPLASLRTSLGRCGEESTFAVTALRAVGIPARQCYTPRWAHCDDNHAWVEVWVNGQWKFLGACEPDPELNMGWFAIPSTRCMMVHTKAFGRYNGDEEVVRSTSLYSELNLLKHYAPVRHVTVTVCDAAGKPVQDATVKFKLYNYAEYYTLASCKTDSDGKAGLTTGLGDLLVWASDGKHYGYAKLDVRRTDTLTLPIDRTGMTEYVEVLDIVPPVPGEAKVVPSEAAQAANAKRIAYEDSLRGAYVATFMCNRPRETWQVTPNDNLTEEQLTDLITRSEGNYAEIVKFIDNHTEKEEGVYLYDYLNSYSDKDLRDITADVLEHHLTRQPTGMDVEVYKKGIMPARISNELVRPWRNLKPYQAPEVDNAGNYFNCPISPEGVQTLRHSDAHSRDIYYVAACRANNIPAYLDNATNTIYRWQNNAWERITLDSSNDTADNTAVLTLTYKGSDPKVPLYYPHFTLQKYVDGDFVTFDFEGDARMAIFPATLEIEPGYYCLSTGNRNSTGKVGSRMEFFAAKAGQHIEKEITLLPFFENQNGESNAKISTDLSINGTKMGQYAGSKGTVLAFMGTHREPAKHLVKEILQHEAEFTKWGGRIYAVTSDPQNKELQQIANADIVPVPAGTKDAVEKTVAEALGLKKYEYPLVSVVDKNGNILFYSTGYKIGLAELLLKYCK